MTFSKIYKKVNFVSYKIFKMTFSKIYKKVNFVGNKIFQNDFFLNLHFFKKKLNFSKFSKGIYSLMYKIAM